MPHRLLCSLRLAGLLTAPLLGVASAATPAVQTFPLRVSGGAATGGAGQLSVRPVSPGLSVSVLTLRGLTPHGEYVAHYHALGPLGPDPCASQGPVTLAFPAFKTDARGQAQVSLRADPARISGNRGAYVHVHTAADLTDVPLCAALLQPAAAPAAPGVTVRIGDNLFQPASLKIVAGTTVTWLHTGQITHNILSLTLADLRSADLRPGDRYSHTFTTPGTYTYYCSYHDGMSATITVTHR